MDFKVNRNNEYNKDYGIIIHNHFKQIVFRISIGKYNWSIIWAK